MGMKSRSVDRHIHPVQNSLPIRRAIQSPVLSFRRQQPQNPLSFRRLSEAKKGGICCPPAPPLKGSTPLARPTRLPPFVIPNRAPSPVRACPERSRREPAVPPATAAERTNTPRPSDTTPTLCRSEPGASPVRNLLFLCRSPDRRQADGVHHCRFHHSNGGP
jgi:hypothetical protein